MSTIKTSNIQHPDSPDSNLETNADGSVHANKLDADELTTGQINADTITTGTINATGINIDDTNIQETISQTKLSLEKNIVPSESNEYTLELEDAGKVLTLDDEDEEKVVTVNIPNDNEVNFEVGSNVSLYRGDNANIEVSANNGVDIKTPLAPGPSNASGGNPGNGTNGLGGGGGGSNGYNGNLDGGAGGSGIVVVRYRIG